MFNELNILKPFLINPTKEFNVREIARIINISPASASKKLKSFAKSLLKQRNFKNLLLFKANIESEEYRDLKVYYNIKSIKESGLISFLNNYYLKPIIILFGSFSSGYDTETSDLDIAIISEKTSVPKELKQYESKLKHNIHLLTARKISDFSNTHLINNLLNGITLQGSVEWTSMSALKKD
ncbi:nucleotidyltransferase domain-containing protein [Candidatus Woesearchaeota archaeon]|nr:nucleotidyltransferase domain-containing protein [Candidatus Woesearchaeota archaeon]